MKYRRITDLSNKLIKQVINDIFKPLRITRIIKDKEKQEVVVFIVCEWVSENDDGADEVAEFEDRIVLMTPLFLRV